MVKSVEDGFTSIKNHLGQCMYLSGVKHRRNVKTSAYARYVGVESLAKIR